MVPIDFSLFVLIYVSAGLALVLALWVYYDHRDQQLHDSERAQSLFHCLKCGRLYTAPRAGRSACCPDCGFENSKLKF